MQMSGWDQRVPIYSRLRHLSGNIAAVRNAGHLQKLLEESKNVAWLVNRVDVDQHLVVRRCACPN